jgi:hypothetical protein
MDEMGCSKKTIIKIVIYAQLLCSILVFGQPTNSTPVTIDLTPEQTESLKSRFRKTTQKLILYHGTNSENAQRYSIQSHIDAGEVSFLNLPTGDRQVYGPGIYTSSGLETWKSYGTEAIAIEINEGTLIFDLKIAEDIFGKKLNHVEQSQLCEKLGCIRPITDNWFTLHHSEQTQNVFHAASKGVLSTDPVHEKSLLAIFSGINKADPDRGGYLESLYHLANYQEGVSFLQNITKGSQANITKGYHLRTQNPLGLV